MSQPRAAVLRLSPRWSLPLIGAAVQVARSPAPAAGLAATKATVLVGPPLLASGSSPAETLSWSPLTLLPSPEQAVPGLPIRLCPPGPSVRTPWQSGAEASPVLPAMSVLDSVAVAVACRRRPPTPGLLLPAIVELTNVALPLVRSTP